MLNSAAQIREGPQGAFVFAQQGNEFIFMQGPNGRGGIGKTIGQGPGLCLDFTQRNGTPVAEMGGFFITENPRRTPRHQRVSA